MALSVCLGEISAKCSLYFRAGDDEKQAVVNALAHFGVGGPHVFGNGFIRCIKVLEVCTHTTSPQKTRRTLDWRPWYAASLTSMVVSFQAERGLLILFLTVLYEGVLNILGTLAMGCAARIVDMWVLRSSIYCGSQCSGSGAARLYLWCVVDRGCRNQYQPFDLYEAEVPLAVCAASSFSFQSFVATITVVAKQIAEPYASRTVRRPRSDSAVHECSSWFRVLPANMALMDGC